MFCDFFTWSRRVQKLIIFNAGYNLMTTERSPHSLALHWIEHSFTSQNQRGVPKPIDQTSLY